MSHARIEREILPFLQIDDHVYHGYQNPSRSKDGISG